MGERSPTRTGGQILVDQLKIHGASASGWRTSNRAELPCSTVNP